MEYITLCSSDIGSLDAQVNEKLAQGYELYGHPYTASHDDHPNFFQAVTRRKQTKSVLA